MVKTRLAIAAFAGALLFALLGLFLPPLGQIDSTVNFFVAQLLVLTATLLGVESYFDKVKKS